MLAQVTTSGETDWFGEPWVRIVIILGAAVLVTLASRLVVSRFRKRLEGKASVTQELNLQRATTLTGALSTALIVVIWALAILMALGELGQNIAPLLASAGVAGVALGFGAQSLVRDTLSGFFILLENQFGVGDNLEVQTPSNKVAGRVESLTLRVTSIRAFDGALHFVPNGNIVVASNRSKGWARAIIDVRTAYDEDVEHLRSVLEELFEELKGDRTLSEWIHEAPSVLGVERMGHDALVMRVIADTRPSKVMDVERLLRERITRRLLERGIRVPVTPATPGSSGSDGR
ncbi:MAG TPA: mechanosensitive ion channel family protein [Actinomycetota bacterium]|nr:mechanosensitive ion channel family protein [Actinomycetota bacterium]